MAHFRSTVTDRLVTAISDNGVTVEKSRVYPTDDGDLPRYLVYADDESVDWSGGVGSAHRTLTTTIEVLLEGGAANIEDQLGDHCQYIEDQLNPQGSIAGILWSRVTATDLDYVDTGVLKLGIAKLTVEVLYVTLTASAATPS